MIRPHAGTPLAPLGDPDPLALLTGAPDALVRLMARAGAGAAACLARARRLARLVRCAGYTLLVLGLLVAALLAWLAPAAPAGAAPGAPAAPPLPASRPGDAFSFVPGGPIAPGPGFPGAAVVAQQRQFPLPQPIGPSLAPQLIWAAVKPLLIGVIEEINDALRAALESWLQSPYNFIGQTPREATYDSRAVTGLWNQVLRAAMGLLLLTGVAGGILVIVKDRLGVEGLEGGEVLARLPFGAALANASLWLVQLPIDLNNALCALIGAGTFPGWEFLGRPSELLGPPGGGGNAIAGLIYLGTCLALGLQLIMRLALIDVLIIVSPLALLCWILPQTDGWARRWASTFTAAVFTQFLQIVALRVGGQLFTTLPGAGVGLGEGLLSVMVSIGLLLLTMRLPELLRVPGGRGGGVRLIAVARLASSFGRKRGGG